MSENINRADDLKKMLAPLERMIGYKAEFNRAFGPSGSKIIIPAYKMMRDQLLVLAPADGKKVNVSNNNKQLARQAIEMMVAVVTSGSISQYFRNFAEIFLPLMNNWNLQLGGTRSITTSVNACQRILDDMMTAKDTTDVMNRANKKLKELLRYKPSGFELSRAYLKTLQADIEKKVVAKQC